MDWLRIGQQAETVENNDFLQGADFGVTTQCRDEIKIPLTEVDHKKFRTSCWSVDPLHCYR